MKKLIALLTALILTFSLTTIAYGAGSPQGKKEYLVTVYNNINPSPDAGDTVEEGEQYSASAEDKAGYDFVGWSITGKYEIVSGSLTSKDITLIPKSDLTLTAFYTLRVDKKDDELKVEYTHNIEGLEDGNYEIIKKGEKVEISASDKIPGYAFVKWEIIGDYQIISGSLDSKDLVILPLGNIIVKQIFEQVSEDQDDKEPEEDKESDKKPPKGETNDSDKSPETGMMLPVFGLVAALGTAVVSKKLSK